MANTTELPVCGCDAALRQITLTTCYYLVLVQKLDTYFTVLSRVEDCINVGTAIKVCSPCLRLYITAAVLIKETVRFDVTAQSDILPLSSLSKILRCTDLFTVKCHSTCYIATTAVSVLCPHRITDS